MATLKTQVNDGDVTAFLNSVEDEQKRADCFEILDMMQKATKAEPKMWGSSMVGFDSYQYTYASGSGGEWFQVGFSPRKQNLTLYIMPGFSAYDELMEKLGKHTTGRSCLYIKRLADIHKPTLRKLINQSVKFMREKYA